jgi:hypothetical protein
VHREAFLIIIMADMNGKDAAAVSGGLLVFDKMERLAILTPRSHFQQYEPLWQAVTVEI